jgi:putative endonuclease
LQTGTCGERAALGYLRRAGYRIVARNYRCALGEIDIVALKNGVLSIIEVKTRSDPHALPEEAVPFAKRRQLTRVATAFIQTRRLETLPCEFDVILVCPGVERRKSTIRHFADAFTAVET